MGASKYHNIPMTVVDTRQRYIQKAVIQDNPVPPPRGRELELGPLLGLLLNHLLAIGQRSLFFIKQYFSQLSRHLPKIKTLPWLKIGVLLLTSFLLFKKDMKFNVALKAPIAGLLDDQETTSSNVAVAQTVAYKSKTSKNAYAPMAAKDLNTQRAYDFIREYSPLAIEEMHRTGIPASIKIAQALVESHAGNSRLAKNNNNFFGIKCFSKNCKKGHCTNATDDHHKDFFRKYTSAKASWSHHSSILTQGRYKKLSRHKKNYKKWAAGLKAAGYATDKSYDKKLISVIKKYSLDKLDKR